MILESKGRTQEHHRTGIAVVGRRVVSKGSEEDSHLGIFLCVKYGSDWYSKIRDWSPEICSRKRDTRQLVGLYDTPPQVSCTAKAAAAKTQSQPVALD